MFDNIILFHNQRLSQLIGTFKRFTTLREIHINDMIDENFKAFLNAEVNWWIYEEQLRRSINPLFDFSNDDFASILDEYDRNLYQNARFDRSTLKYVIETAITSRLNYLLRPRIALKWFVFRGEPTKPFNEIIKRLSYFCDYSYLLEGFVKYVNENKFIKSDNDLFSTIEFSTILEKIDTDYLFTLQPEQFVELIYPMIAFLNPDLNEINLKTEFPIEALIIFLDDKGIEPLKASVEHLLIQNSVSSINGEIFLKLIYELLNELESNPTSFTNQNSNYKSDLSPEIMEPLDELNKSYKELMDMNDDIAQLNRTIKEMRNTPEPEEEN